MKSCRVFKITFLQLRHKIDKTRVYNHCFGINRKKTMSDNMSKSQNFIFTLEIRLKQGFLTHLHFSVWRVTYGHLDSVAKLAIENKMSDKKSLLTNLSIIFPYNLKGKKITI